MITKTKYYFKKVPRFYSKDILNKPVYIIKEDITSKYRYRLIDEDGTKVDQCQGWFIKEYLYCYLDLLKEKFK